MRSVSDDGTDQLSRLRRTILALSGSWTAVARTSVVIVVVAGAVHYLGIEIDIGIATISSKACTAEIVHIPTPYPLPSTGQELPQAPA